jgi:hypothetical protein
MLSITVDTYYSEKGEQVNVWDFPYFQPRRHSTVYYVVYAVTVSFHIALI